MPFEAAQGRRSRVETRTNCWVARYKVGCAAGVPTVAAAASALMAWLGASGQEAPCVDSLVGKRKAKCPEGKLCALLHRGLRPHCAFSGTSGRSSLPWGWPAVSSRVSWLQSNVLLALRSSSPAHSCCRQKPGGCRVWGAGSLGHP